MIIYCVGHLLVYIALLLQLIRIFAPSKKGLMFRLLQFLLWINILFWICIGLAEILQCVPMVRIWNPVVGKGGCVSSSTEWIVSGSFNLVQNLATLIIPLWATWRLQMAKGRKIGVCAVFATGLLCVTILFLPWQDVQVLTKIQQSGPLLPAPAALCTQSNF